LQTDREFSAMSEKEGMFQAFLYNVAEDGVILRDNSYPTKGRNSLIEYYKGKRDTAFILTWEPMFERISKSGDLGYTYGIYTSTVKATGNMTKGTYVSIWQKQADGSWKFILDTGTQGLPESQNYSLFSFLFRASDAKIPPKDNIENITKPVLMLLIRPGYVEGFIGFLPI
jgi:ketosteroid isomerase-like protein